MSLHEIINTTASVCVCVCAAGCFLRGLLAALTEEHEEEDTYQRGHDHQHRQTNTLPHPPLL